ncbi:MAG: sulfatase, partial [Pirellulales bacterium]|nr:sulfatase [Pirellulales bacterium]
MQIDSFRFRVTLRQSVGTLFLALGVLLGAVELQAAITWQGGAGDGGVSSNWNVSGTPNQTLPPQDDNAAHTFGYENQDFVITAPGSVVTFNDRVALSDGSITISDSSVNFLPTTNNLSGVNLGHANNALNGIATTATFTNSTVFAQRSDSSGNGFRVDNGSSLTLSGGSLTVGSEGGAFTDNIAFQIRGGASTVSLNNSALLESGYLDFGGGGGSVTLDSGTITLLSDNPLRNIVSGNINWTGAAGDATIVNSNNSGTSTLAARLAAGAFSIDGTQVFDTATIVGGRSLSLTTVGSTDTLSLVAPATLTVFTDTGLVRIHNTSGEAINMDSYVIESADVEANGGSLNPAAWLSIEDRNLTTFPAGNNDGAGWEEGGNPNDLAVTESFLLGSSTMEVGQMLALGNLYSTAGTPDLSFRYHQVGKATSTVGLVQYLSTTPREADFDENGTVDAGDLADWRTGYGLAGSAQKSDGDADFDGDVDGTDFLIWQRQAGSPPPLAAGASVPEPGALALAALGASALTLLRRNRTFTWALMLCATLVGFAATNAYAQAPNIVFIMADDLGWADTSNTLTTMGDPSDFYETPALERIASEGMAFNNAYANQNCAPTRTALLSGAYAPRSTNNVYQVNHLNRGGNGTLLEGPSQGLPSGTDALPTSTVTYAETLQSAGYTTAYIGKFHVTETGAAGAAQIVSDHGFHFNFGGSTAGAPGNYHASGGVFSGSIGPGLDPYATNYTQAYVNANIKPYANGTDLGQIDMLVGTAKHVTDASADAAIDFMNNNSSNPFFIQYSSHAVHTPIDNNQARDDLLHKYQNKTPGVEDTNASFGALIEGLDQSVARIVDHLENTADPRNPGKMLSDNTLLIFYSDNGGAQNQSNNGTLKGEKGEFDEGGIRVPMIAWSDNPNLVDGGTINSTPVAPIDFYKTFATLAGATLPAGQPLDGEDLTGIIADNSAVLGRDNLYWHLPGYLIGGGRNQRPQTVVRSGDWKLLYNYEDQSYELYNLATDLSESNNLASTSDTMVDDLSTDILNWLDSVDAPLATLRNGTLELFITGQAYANGVITNHVFETVTISAGQEVPFIVDATPNDADTNMDGSVNLLDWLDFKAGQNADMSSLTLMQSFQMGDIDHDLDNDIDD